MSMYQDIYRDLPSRVFKVWQQTKTHPEQKTEDLSVTALLMAAATGLAMPWDTLKDVGHGNGNNWNVHPSFVNGNKKHYQAVLERCSAFLAQKISATESLKDISLRHCQSQADIRDTAENSQSGTQLELHKHTVRCAVRVLRNALAHNNIVAFGQTPEQIDWLGFFSENRVGSGCISTIDGYIVLTISKDALADFLNAWFSSLIPKKS